MPVVLISIVEAHKLIKYFGFVNIATKERCEWNSPIKGTRPQGLITHKYNAIGEITREEATR